MAEPQTENRAEGGETAALRCGNHPGVETYLRCGKCGQPICVRCVVMTPVGARCRACANPRRLPVFEMSPGHYVRAIGAAAAAAWVGGAAAAILWLAIPFGGLLVPLALGYLIGEVVSRATNRKRATSLKVIAALGVLAALALRSAFFVFLRGPGIADPAALVVVGLAGLIGTLASPFALLGLALGIFVAVSRI